MKINKPLIIKIVLAILLAVVLFFAGSYCQYYYESRQAEKEALQKEQRNIELRKQFGINIGGVKPYMSGKDVINLVKSSGYNYSFDENIKSDDSNGNNRMYIHNLLALGINWNEFYFFINKDKGVLDMGLTTKASELSEEQVLQCLKELMLLFPGGKIMPEPRFTVIIGDKTVSVPQDDGKLFEYWGLFRVTLDYRKDRDELNCYIAPHSPRE